MGETLIDGPGGVGLSDTKDTVIFHGQSPDGNKFFDHVVGELERLIVFPHPWNSRVVALFIFQTYLKNILPTVFYIGLVGTKGTAKTTVLEIVKELSHRGIIFGNGSSIAGIARSCNEGETICIDEFDELSGDIKTTLEGVARQGYRADSVTIAKWDIKNNKRVDINPFGPKAISFRKKVDEALRSRLFSIGMATVRPSAEMTNRLIDIMIRNEDDIRTVVAAFCDERIQETMWDRNSVRSFMASKAFREEAVNLSDGCETLRDTELVIMWLLLSKIIGIDLSNELKNVLASQAESIDDEIGDFRETIRLEWESRGKPPKVGITDIRIAINATRKTQNERPYSDDKFRQLMRDIGAVDNVELRRVTGGRNGVFFTEEFIQKIYHQASLAPPVSSLFKYEQVEVASLNGDSDFTSEDRRVSIVNIQLERVKLLIEVSEAISKRNTHTREGTFTLDEVTQELMDWPIEPIQIEKDFIQLVKDGTFYEPKPGSGEYKKT